MGSSSDLDTLLRRLGESLAPPGLPGAPPKEVDLVFQAAREGDEDTVMEAIANGFRLSEEVNKDGHTVLFYAARHFFLFTKLGDLYAGPTASPSNTTLLHMAAKHSANHIRYVYDRFPGIDPDAVDRDGRTALTQALFARIFYRKNVLDRVRALARGGASVSLKTGAWTPLSMCVATKETTLAVELVRLGAPLEDPERLQGLYTQTLTVDLYGRPGTFPGFPERDWWRLLGALRAAVKTAPP